MNSLSASSLWAVLLVWCVCGSALASPVASGDQLLRYRMSGTLEEGGQFFGTFAIDPLAVDQQSFDGLGRFDLVDADFTLTGTSLFAGGITSGSTSEGILVQSEPAMRQVITFTVLASDGQSNAFNEIVFRPFIGDADVAAPLGPFSDGYFDGAGQTPITNLTVIQVPEPTSVTLFAGCVAMLGWHIRRHRCSANH